MLILIFSLSVSTTLLMDYFFGRFLVLLWDTKNNMNGEGVKRILHKREKLGIDDDT